MPDRNHPAHPDIEKILLTERQIKARIAELGSQISRDYAGRSLTMVSILKGSVIFLGDLMRAVSVDCSVDFIGLSSYSGTKSSGVVRLTLDLRENPEGKDILIVEDIVDTGLTLHYLLDNFKTRSPRSVETCSFLNKPSCRKVSVPVKYVGFDIPNEFVVGFGLDHNERFRNLPYVGVMRPNGGK
ncbi:MAG: hypoxanthine phosphoribosyltransferase [Elusimicrobia bacterium]|nr:hypoxanthine phosphoribosyltransferase [Elusimicrobiota bacterium]